MRIAELRSLVRIQRPEIDPVARRLARCLSIADVRELARKRLPTSVFDYIDGGADEELTLARNESAFRRKSFQPRALQDVSDLDIGVDVFGRSCAAPLALCPTGYTRMVHVDGEGAVARAASARSLPYALSTVGTTSIEELARTGHENLWFQLYVLRDRGLTKRLVERAQVAGYQVLEIVVDTAVSGRRERDVRNGLTIPPALTARTLVDIGRHVGYWTAMVRSPVLEFANIGEPSVGEARVSAANMASMFDPTFDFRDLAELRACWRGPILLKGQLSPDDARRAVDSGIDGIHLSNHGGRQLDRAPATIDLVRPLRAALGDNATIVLDSGVRHGADIAMALALGANLCAIARPYLYGLAVGGERGVGHVLDILVSQLKRTMQLLGVSNIAALRDAGEELVRSG